MTEDQKQILEDPDVFKFELFHIATEFALEITRLEAEIKQLKIDLADVSGDWIKNQFELVECIKWKEGCRHHYDDFLECRAVPVAEYEGLMP
jgi:hypothetical protein